MTSWIRQLGYTGQFSYTMDTEAWLHRIYYDIMDTEAWLHSRYYDIIDTAAGLHRSYFTPIQRLG
jgi:hypothetical protein